jgi:hypothetical protein
VHAKILFEARSCEKLRRIKPLKTLRGASEVCSKVDKSREESLGFLRRNHQRKETDGQESVGRISKIPPAVRSAREARRLQLCPEFKLRRLWTVGSSHRHPSAVGLTRSCTKFKLRE